MTFDELAGDSRVEERLDGALRRGERCAVIAPSGAGKSSVLSYLLGPLAEGVAPIFVPVAASPDEHVTDPASMAKYLLEVTAQAAHHALDPDTIDAARKRSGDRTLIETSTRRGGVRAGWGWLHGDLARQVDAQTRVEVPATIGGRTDALMQLLAAIADSGYVPVLVFDDSDRWVGDSVDHVVRSFFGGTMRWLAELPATLVATVHSHYFERASRTDLLAVLDTQIDLPELADRESALARILERRLILAGVGDDGADPPIEEVFTPSAIEELADVYDTTRSIRRVVQVVHIALAEALLVPVDVIDARQIEAVQHAE